MGKQTKGTITPTMYNQLEIVLLDQKCMHLWTKPLFIPVLEVNSVPNMHNMQ